jgi:hypothetical protein
MLVRTNMGKPYPHWYMWGDCLAVIPGSLTEALVCGSRGWRDANSAEVGHDGWPISEEEARSGWPETFEWFGEPPTLDLFGGIIKSEHVPEYVPIPD